MGSRSSQQQQCNMYKQQLGALALLLVLGFVVLQYLFLQSQNRELRLSLLQLEAKLQEALSSPQNTSDPALQHAEVRPQPSDDAARRRELQAYFNNQVRNHVRANNWDLGCSDEVALAPLLRSVYDRLYITARHNQVHMGRGGPAYPSRTFIDVGANEGQEAGALVDIFHVTEGMCRQVRHNGGTNPAFRFFSFEPSPMVFCRLTAYARAKNLTGPNFYAFQIALSDQAAEVNFLSDGDEGGHMHGAAQPSTKAFEEVYLDAQLCTDTQGSLLQRETIVRSYTLDEVYGTINRMRPSGHVALDEIFCLKVDAEGSDIWVLKGAQDLLQKNKITFVIFEVDRAIKSITALMASFGYLCFIISAHELWPVSPPSSSHHPTWWYLHLDQFSKDDASASWWGNCVCGIRGSEALGILWRMYHSTSENARHSWLEPYVDGVNESRIPTTFEKLGHEMRLADAFPLL